MFTLYTLHDPLDAEHIRYCGYTSMKPRARLRAHINDSRRRPDRHHRARWINKLLTDGREPVMTMLSFNDQLSVVDTLDRAHELERSYIKLFKLAGHRLTNSTDGGDGMIGFKPSDETRARMSASQTGRKSSPETRAKVSAAHKGRPSPNKGIPRTPEARANMRAGWARRGASMTPESVSKRARQERRRNGDLSRMTTKGRPCPNKGIPRTPEVRAKVSASKQAKGVSMKPDAIRLRAKRAAAILAAMVA